jgi:membrane-associated phospholipid phosphatase
MTAILQFDEFLFQIINGQWHNDVLDFVMPWWRDKKFWIPAYLVGAGYLVWKYKLKSIFFILSIALTIGISDTLSSKVIKKTVKRPRPCRNEVLAQDLNLLVHCGGGYSFTSSHATNHFALAVFLITLFGWMKKRWKYLLLFWAASIAFGQVYVGVHYPFDVIAGAMLGALVGWLSARFFSTNKFCRRFLFGDSAISV